MKRVLVTGSNGFVGKHLVDELCSRGYSVFGIDKTIDCNRKINPKCSFSIGDIRRIEFNSEYDIIYHLAALTSLPQSFIYPEEYVSTNVWGTYNLLRSFPSARFVNASSSAATENKSPYGISKRSSEHFCNMHKNSVSIRFMNIFGEGQYDLTKAVPSFLSALKHNNKAVIYGDGSLQRDYTYVQDLVDEMIGIGESKIRGRTETGYGQPIKIIDLYKLLARTAKKKENFTLGPSRQGDMKFTCSKYKIKEPRYGFAEGIRRTVRWYLGEETF